MIFGYFTLFVALVISGVAAYYSIVGLTAIFAAAVIPIIIMGAALEVGKITAAVWLKLNWARARWTYKLYLVPAVAFLMLLTSMGIFGFLSKAHSDQSLVSGDVLSKIAVYDERIKTERDNIEMARRALAQMDAQVEARLSRSDSEQGAERAVQIRRQQATERGRLLKEIADAQKKIAQLNEDRAPIAAEVRKVEAEVGPIKYIAALIYGDTTDATLLEDAVRWVIIIIVAVFDPLALVLILAAQQSIRWAREEKSGTVVEEALPQEQQVDVSTDPAETGSTVSPVKHDPFDFSKYSYLYKGFGNPHPPGIEPEKPLVWNPKQDNPPAADKPEPVKNSKAKNISKKNKPKKSKLQTQIAEPEIATSTVEQDATSESNLAETTKKSSPRFTLLADGYVEVEGKILHERVLPDTYPDLLHEVRRSRLESELSPRADNILNQSVPGDATFGIEFPTGPSKGEMFLNVSTLPSRLYKFNGSRWIEVDKSSTDSYTYNNDYLNYLSEQLNQGVITVDDLTLGEQEQIEQFLKKNAK